MIIVYIFNNLQVIPSLLSQTAETNDKSPKTFAYLSVENTKEPEKESGKALRGQIKKCNLTNSRMAGGMTLSEVKEFQFVFVINTFCVVTSWFEISS